MARPQLPDVKVGDFIPVSFNGIPDFTRQILVQGARSQAVRPRHLDKAP